MVVNGWPYCKKKTTNGKARWVCSSHHRKGCKASVYTYDDTIIRSNLIHNHEKSRNFNDSF